MVKKLFKHEFKAMFRSLLPIEGVILGIGILARFILFFEQDTTAFDIVYGSTIAALVIALIAGPVAAFVLGITRFHKNLFTGEGYLSFTLPVTPTQHLYVKVITAVVMEILAVLVAVLTFCIATSGDLLTEVIKAGTYLIKLAFTQLSAIDLSFYIVEIILFLIVSAFYGYLVIYACISLGQTAKKNRTLCAVGIYFGYYMISQTVGTVFVVAINALTQLDFFNKIISFLEEHPYETAHMAFCGVTVWYAILSVVFFFISRFVMRKKLNLE